MARNRIIHTDPDILGGKPVFVGTRVPLQALVDYIEGGHTLDQFLADFPTVNEVMARCFTEPYPARAAVGVAALPKGAAVEMDAVMVLEK